MRSIWCDAPGLRPAAALCTILRDDGESARMADLKEFAARHELPIVFVRELVSYRLTNETLVRRVSEVPFALLEGIVQGGDLPQYRRRPRTTWRS